MWNLTNKATGEHSREGADVKIQENQWCQWGEGRAGAVEGQEIKTQAMPRPK